MEENTFISYTFQSATFLLSRPPIFRLPVLEGSGRTSQHHPAKLQVLTPPLLPKLESSRAASGGPMTQTRAQQPNKNFWQIFGRILGGKSHSLGGEKGVRFVFDILYFLKKMMFAAKLMVGRLCSFWEGLFSGAMSVSGRVRVYLT